MAPWPEQGNEPKAPDKSCNKSVENSSTEDSKVNLGNSEETELNATTSKCDDKQGEDRNAHVSSLDDGQLRALLDEAIAYKCPKDREGKSNLFRELLLEAEANEDGDSRRGLSGVCGSRYYSNSSRRRGRRDAQVSERQTRGGSLQNLVHASNSEFDPAAGFSGYHTGGSRTARRSKRLSTGSGSYSGGSVGSGSGSRDCGGVSVSARQREGGSLPSNVNVGGMLTLGGLEYHSTPTSLPFDDIKTCKQAAVKRKELTHSSSSNEFMSMPVQTSTINSSGSGSSGVESGSALSSTNSSCTAPKSEFMVLDLGDYAGENTGESKGGSAGSVSISSNVTSTGSGSVDNGISSTTQREEKNLADSNGMEEGLELEVLQRTELTTRVPNYTSRATLEVGHSENKKILPSSSVIPSEGPGEVDAAVTFPLEILQCSEKSSSTSVNGVEQNSLQLRSSYNSVKSIMSSGSPCSGPRDEKSSVNKGGDIAKRSAGSESVGKAAAASAAAPTSASNVAASAMPMLSVPHHLSVLSLPPTSWINTPLVPDVNRLTFTHGSSKDCSGESKNQNKSLDENGNAVNRLESATSNSTERKGKQRKAKTNNDRNVIMSQNIEGYRGDKDLDTVLKFIESNSDGKGGNKTKSTTSHSNGPMNFSSKQQRNCTRLLGCDRTKPRRERGLEDGGVDEGKSRTSAGKQVAKENRGKGSKLKKSNSLEEISKTKLEDLTSSNAKGKESDDMISAGNNDEDESGAVLIRRPKKQSTLDNCECYGEKGRVGDRRSWGTEEGQQYYCNDGVTVSADESSSGSGQNSRKRRGVSSNITVSDEKKKVDRDEVANAISFPAATGSSAMEETEFLVVTKKQRRRKRRSSSGGRGTSASTAGSIFGDDSWRPYHNNYNTSYYQNRENSNGSYYPRKTFTNTSGGFPPHDRTVERDSGGVMLYTQYRHHRPRSPDHLRRKSTSSMPPSDKSDSSDLDSVHSLPVSSTTQKLTLDQTSTSSGSTPQASYADIARMASNNIPSAPNNSNNYVNINLNASRWPVMGKNIPTNLVGNPTNTVATVSTVCTLTSSNSAVSVPVVSSNPQFITGAKLNIGAPPVSGSKVAVFSGNNSPGLHCATSMSTIVAASDEVCQGSVRKDTDGINQSVVETVSTCKSRSSLLSPTDTRSKKDAMTNTNLDYSTVSPCSSEEKEVGLMPSGGLKTNEVAVNFLRDGEYPSIEESLASDKPKSIKVAQVHSWHSSPVESISSVVPSSNSPCNDKSGSPIVSECKKDSVLNEQRSQVFVSNLTAGGESNAASSVAIVSAPTKTCVPDSVLPDSGVASGQGSEILADVAKSKDALPGKVKNLSKKVSSSGTRPPVIILDENDQNFSYSDGLVTIGELTFGFEVNEQLLMPDSSEDSAEGKPASASVISEGSFAIIEESKPITSQSSVLMPLTSCSVGEDFSARFREPLTQPDNHDKIVTFVGLAWDDILKEMNGMSVHSGAKVQYYSGQ